MNCKFLLTLDAPDGVSDDTKPKVFRVEPDITLKDAMVKYFAAGDQAALEAKFGNMGAHDDAEVLAWDALEAHDNLCGHQQGSHVVIGQLIDDLPVYVLVQCDMDTTPYYDGDNEEEDS